MIVVAGVANEAQFFFSNWRGDVLANKERQAKMAVSIKNEPKGGIILLIEQKKILLLHFGDYTLDSVDPTL